MYRFARESQTRGQKLLLFTIQKCYHAQKEIGMKPRDRNLLLLCISTVILGAALFFITRPSTDEMVGQMIMTGFHGDGAGDNEQDLQIVESQIRRGLVGGVILFDIDMPGLRARGIPDNEVRKHIFSNNIKNTAQVKSLTRRLQDAGGGNLFVAIDQEGGKVQRLKPEHGFPSTPAAADMATDPNATYTIAYDLGTRLHDLGINVNFAPVLDVNVNPDCPVIGKMGRSFSGNPDVVARYAGAFAKGLGDAKMAYSFKHFPGHGSSAADSHHGITDITKTWREYELAPYRKLVSQNPRGAMVMVGHILNRNIDDVPASLSRRTIEILRNMGFDGVVVSDDMTMGAIVNEYSQRDAIKRAINAGNDLLVFGNNIIYDPHTGERVHAIIIDLIRNGEIKKSRIRESYRRIMKLKKDIGLKQH